LKAFTCLFLSGYWVQFLQKTGYLPVFKIFHTGLSYVWGSGCYWKKRKTGKPLICIPFTGALSVLLHPQQIPFWLVTGLLIHSKMLFSSDNTVFYGFLFCNAAGALAAFIFYMLSGKLLLDYFKLNTGIINKVMGVLYIGLFIYEISGIF